MPQQLNLAKSASRNLQPQSAKGQRATIAAYASVSGSAPESAEDLLERIRKPDYANRIRRALVIELCQLEMHRMADVRECGREIRLPP